MVRACCDRWLPRCQHTLTVVGAARRKRLPLASGVIKSGQAFDDHYGKGKSVAA
jgi:hypothetical protein